MAEPDLADTLRSLGLPEESIERAIARGDPEGAIFETVLLAQASDRTVSPDEIEARGGLPVADLERLIEAFGLPVPAPDQPAFTEAEATVFVEMRRLRDVWPAEVALQVARVYGRLLARIAQTEVDTFRVYVERPLRARSDDALAGISAIQTAFVALLPLADPLLLGVHRRWLEYELTQAAVSEAESGAGRRLPGAVQMTVLFVDLKDFTSYADTHGDAAAVAAVERLAAVVSRESGPCRFQKLLGDGVMLCYAEARPAVESARRIMAAMRAGAPPGVHASIHTGAAILREGDYFGSAVNVAARLLDTADEHELVATRAIVEACPEVAWDAARLVRIRGLGEPIATYRLREGTDQVREE